MGTSQLRGGNDFLFHVSCSTRAETFSGLSIPRPANVIPHKNLGVDQNRSFFNIFFTIENVVAHYTTVIYCNPKHFVPKAAAGAVLTFFDGFYDRGAPLFFGGLSLSLDPFPKNGFIEKKQNSYRMSILPWPRYEYNEKIMNKEENGLLPTVLLLFFLRPLHFRSLRSLPKTRIYREKTKLLPDVKFALA